MPGPHDFDQCIFGNWLGFQLITSGFANSEQQLGFGYPLTKNPTRPGGNVIEMLDGSRVVQLSNFTIAGAENMQRWIWSVTVQADEEDNINLFKLIRALGRPTYMVDFDVELDAIVSYNGQTTAKINRLRASDVFSASTFNPTLYPDKLLVDGTEWTEVVGAPAFGGTEWSWTAGQEGGTITLSAASLSGGEIIEFRYYPAYKVHLQNAPATYQQFNDLIYQYTFVEVGLIQDSLGSN